MKKTTLTKPTKHYRTLKNVFSIFSIACFALTPIYFTIQALIQGTLAVEKIALVSTVLVVLILSAVSVVNKVALRSRMWILLIGLWMCLDNFITPLLFIAITQILDELVFSPLKAKYKHLYVINREIDKRN